MKKFKCFLQNTNYDILFALHELWKYFVCNTWIIKKWKCPFETQELWKVKIFVLQYRNYENIFLQYMNYEIKKMFVCNT